jgi:GNAT superfamily N-acetyltransferase
MQSNPVKVAPADPQSPEATRLLAELSAELGARYDDDGAGAFVPADATAPRSAFLIARVEGRAVGCGAVVPHDPAQPHIAEIKRMYVAVEERGRGVSTEVLRELEDRARSFGYTAVRLETGLLQPEAIHLYVKAGYTRIARYGTYAKNPMSACFQKTLG